MGTSILQLVTQAFYRAFPDQSEADANVYFTQFESWLPQCFREMAQAAVAGKNPERQYLTKAYAVPVSAGQYPISSAFFSDLQTESLPGATLTHASSVRGDGSLRPLEYVEPKEINYPQPGTDFIFFTVERQVIRTRDQMGALDSLTGDITIRDAVFTPTVTANGASTTLPPQLESVAIDWLAAKAQALAGGGAQSVPTNPPG